jgi:hypothetical protein
VHLKSISALLYSELAAPGLKRWISRAGRELGKIHNAAARAAGTAAETLEERLGETGLEFLMHSAILPACAGLLDAS